MRSFVLLLLLCPFAHGQTLTLPPEVKGQPGAFISIPAKTDGKIVRWVSLDSGLQLFPVELLKDSKTAVATGPAGIYRLLAYTSVKDTPSEPAICRVVIGVPPPPKPVDPPEPDEPPTPVIPSDGVRVLIVYEATTGAPMLTKEQKSELNSAEFRNYLNAKTAREDGHPAWRIYDKDIDLSNAPRWWKDAMARPRADMPWMIVTDGRRSFEGPLPAGGDIISKIKSVIER